jgi:general secretion pathway protein C
LTSKPSLKSHGDGVHSVRQAKPVERPRFERFYIYGLLFFLALLTADLIIVSQRDLMMPRSAPPARRPPPPKPMALGNYEKVLARNIFNADGVIPPPLNQGGSGQQNDDATPVPSQLPIILVGTIVHVNPARSLATVEMKNSNKIIPFIPNDDMEGLAKLLKVERKRAIFRNSNNNRIEYIEIKDDSTVVFETNKKAGATEIDQKGNTFSLKRSLIDKLITNLPEHLQQARAVPYTPPGGSKVEGFIILDIQPGSIFEQIGLAKNDIIKGVNGQKVDSPARALELYNELKTAGSISLEVERGGRFETFTYSIQ